MLGFRKKILLSDLILFLIFISLLFPFVQRTVGNIVHRSLEDRAKELISRIQKEPNVDAMIAYLQQKNDYIFFRVTLLDRNAETLYDTRVPNAEVETLSSSNVDQPEVIEALKYRKGYSDRYSE